MDRNTDEPDGFSVECPQCGATLDQIGDQCPHCGHELENEFCATYRPKMPRTVRIIALVLLLVAFLVPLALLLYAMVF